MHVFWLEDTLTARILFVVGSSVPHCMSLALGWTGRPVSCGDLSSFPGRDAGKVQVRGGQGPETVLEQALQVPGTGGKMVNEAVPKWSQSSVRCSTILSNLS